MDAKFKVVLLVVLQIGLAVAQTGDFIECMRLHWKKVA